MSNILSDVLQIETMQQRNAYLLERVKAITIDSLMIIFLMYTFSILFDFFDNVPSWVRKWLFLSLFVFYEPICNSFFTTVGNYFMKIRVRKSSDISKRINIFSAFLRYFFKFVFGWVSFITIFFNKRNRAIHDYVAGSVMVKI